MLATGLMVAYGYVFETFTAWYSGDIFEQYLVINRTIEGLGNNSGVERLELWVCPQSL
jgi:hypothetical protein